MAQEYRDRYQTMVNKLKDDNSTLGYEPNSFGEWQEQPEFAEPPLALEGAADHWDFRKDDTDYYTRPARPFKCMYLPFTHII